MASPGDSNPQGSLNSDDPEYWQQQLPDWDDLPENPDFPA